MSSELLRPGDSFLYMKVGVHANETLADIIARKRAEIEYAGVAFWGYGGSSCHPFNAVQPFVREVTSTGTKVRLLMQEINSRHFAEGAAKEFSADGRSYQPVPNGITVLGSRYALVLKNLEAIDLDIPLSDTTVGVGRMVGVTGDKYIRGHVDKACLVYQPSDQQDKIIHMSLAAELAEPYAVVLR